jgi:hypothetical protein
MGGPPALGLGVGLTTPHRINISLLRNVKKSLGLGRIRMDLRETGWGGIEWTDLARDRDQRRDLVSTVMNLRVP